jgi:hypothetical protein
MLLMLEHPPEPMFDSEHPPPPMKGIFRHDKWLPNRMKGVPIPRKKVNRSVKFIEAHQDRFDEIDRSLQLTPPFRMANVINPPPVPDDGIIPDKEDIIEPRCRRDSNVADDPPYDPGLDRQIPPGCRERQEDFDERWVNHRYGRPDWKPDVPYETDKKKVLAARPPPPTREFQMEHSEAAKRLREYEAWPDELDTNYQASATECTGEPEAAPDVATHRPAKERSELATAHLKPSEIEVINAPRRSAHDDSRRDRDRVWHQQSFNTHAPDGQTLDISTSWSPFLSLR